MKRVIFLKFLILFVALVYAGCAGNPHAVTVPITNPDQRIFYAHFSFLPPKGNNWKTMNGPSERNFRGSKMAVIRFAKPLHDGKPATASEAETVVAGATIHTFSGGESFNQDMLVEYIKTIWDFPYNHPRYNTIDFQYTYEDSNDADCIRYDSKAEDRRGPNFPGSIFIFHNWGLSCVHPKYKNEIYTLNASQRYLKGKTPTNLNAEFEAHLSSLQFQ
jgi:hypothetical protein